MKTTAKGRKAIKSLAVAYEAYYDAKRREDDNGIVCWGLMLIRACKALGMDSIAFGGFDCHTIGHVVAAAEARMAAKAAAA